MDNVATYQSNCSPKSLAPSTQCQKLNCTSLNLYPSNWDLFLQESIWISSVKHCLWYMTVWKSTEKRECNKTTLGRSRILIIKQKNVISVLLCSGFGFSMYMYIIEMVLLMVLWSSQVIIPTESSLRKSVINPLSVPELVMDQEQRAEALLVTSVHSLVQLAYLFLIF